MWQMIKNGFKVQKFPFQATLTDAYFTGKPNEQTLPNDLNFQMYFVVANCKTTLNSRRPHETFLPTFPGRSSQRRKQHLFPFLLFLLSRQTGKT